MRRIEKTSTGHEYRGLGGGRDCNREDFMTLKTLKTSFDRNPANYIRKFSHPC